MLAKFAAEECSEIPSINWLLCCEIELKLESLNDARFLATFSAVLPPSYGIGFLSVGLIHYIFDRLSMDRYQRVANENKV